MYLIIQTFIKYIQSFIKYLNVVLCVPNNSLYCVRTKVDFLGKESQVAFGELGIKGKALIQLQITQLHIKTNETVVT